MNHVAAFKILILLLNFGNLESITVVNHHPDEEYFLEHEVPYADAIAEAKKLKVYPAGMDKNGTAIMIDRSETSAVVICMHGSGGPIPGCKPCTSTEMAYCTDDVIYDHCCCDGSFNEVFPFVKHTCRVGPEECKVQAGDCAEYARLRECCCHSYLASYWKGLANNAQLYPATCVTKFLAILMVLRLLV